jgi:hypothetical protein
MGETSQKRQLVTMLTTAGVVFDEQGDSIQIRATHGPNNEGEAGTYTLFHFDAKGMLMGTATWTGKLRLVKAG